MDLMECLPLSLRARCPCPSREPMTMCLTGRYVGGLGCPVTRGAGGSSPSVDTQASAQLPVSQRGAFGCMEPCDGIELQLPVVSLMSSLCCTDAFGLDCPYLWCRELSLSSAFGGVLRSCKPCSQLVFEVATSLPFLLDVARWGQQLAGDSQAPASAVAPASGAGQCPPGKLLVILPGVTLSTPSCSQGFLGSLPAAVCSCSVNSRKSNF